MEQNKPVVLVIEDEVVNRRIIANILKASYTVLEAENGRVGLAMCESHKGDIAAILLDLVMPVMNGYEFLAAVRGTSFEAVPVIVMTGSSDAETEQKVLNAGAWDFIPKPYNATILNIRLQNAIARSKLAMFEQVRFLSEHDALTGLYNRLKMFDVTREMVLRGTAQEYVFLRADIVHFSLYNAAFGEMAGNRLLCVFAETMQRCAETFPAATYGRMSNDVFCLCATFNGDRDGLLATVHDMQDELNAYSRDYMLKLCAGACVFTRTEMEKHKVNEFYLRASLAARRCKTQYDATLEFSTEQARARLEEETTVVGEMETALREEQFVVFFQPKYETASGLPCGAEALVRWQHPTRGLIAPGAFIPIFERNGFIAKLDYYVWEHTCRYLRKWLDDGRTPCPVSVNISRVSMYNANLDKLLLELVEKYRIQPDLLELEITESAYMTSPALMRELIDKLHKAGFKILMDDFGSSYSSLNTLKDIDVDILKIDMGFVPRGDKVEKSEIILTSIIKMAKWLGMPVTVEGVETRRQRDFLEGAGCDVIQGYYYAKPIPPEEYEAEYIYGEPAAKGEEKAEKQFQPEKQGTILVVDDSDISRTLLRSYFEDTYRVVCCDNAETGLVYLRKNAGEVRMILIDNIMPGMSGINFLHFCQYNNDWKAIPKVMITACDNVDDQLEAFHAGAYDFITKPLVKEIVRARIYHIMETTYHYTTYDHVKQEYEVMAERDSVTGLLTNHSFRELGDHILTTFPEDPMSLMTVDLDDFKQINAQCGFEKGTQLLADVAQELKKTFRRADVIGRVGGDAFAVLLCGIPDKRTATKKSAEVIRELNFMGARKYGVDLSASIGLVYPVRADTIDTIMAKADQALSEAKHARKGVYVVYGESVPAVVEDNKPIVVVCGGDSMTFRELALAYGDAAGFVFAERYAELTGYFAQYGRRIAAVCADMNNRMPDDPDACYQYVRAEWKNVRILALCESGDMEQIRLAVARRADDLLPLPIQPEVVQARLSMVILRSRRQQSVL